MDTGDLLDLSARASQAQGPDRHLDAAICAVVRIAYPHPAMTCLEDWNWTPRGDRVAAQKRGQGMTIHWEPFNLTGDEYIASEMLAGGYQSWISIENLQPPSVGSLFKAVISPPDLSADVEIWPLEVTANTKALAICAATLLILAKINDPGSTVGQTGGRAMYV